MRVLAGVFVVVGATDVLLAVFAMELWPVAVTIAAGLFAALLWHRAGPVPAPSTLRHREPAEPPSGDDDRPSRVAGRSSALQHDRSGGNRRQWPA